MTFGQGAQRVRLFRRFDTRTAGRHLLTAGADGALHSALLRWIVSRASGGYSKHARVVRISYTLSRDSTRDPPSWPIWVHPAPGTARVASFGDLDRVLPAVRSPPSDRVPLPSLCPGGATDATAPPAGRRQRPASGAAPAYVLRASPHGSSRVCSGACCHAPLPQEHPSVNRPP
jgi:hypothetical protein